MGYSGMVLLSPDDRAVLASAYELQVDGDAASAHEWGARDTDLVVVFQQRHSWSDVSEYGP